MAPLLEVENLSVRYGDLIALRDASLTVSEGEVVKSTIASPLAASQSDCGNPNVCVMPLTPETPPPRSS